MIIQINFAHAGPCGTPAIVTTAEEIRENLACSELKIGGRKIVNFSQTESPTKVSAHYTLKRTSELDYLITVNPEFYTEYFNPSNTASIVRGNVEKCLATFNNQLIGPGGEKLKIQLSPPDTNRKALKKIKREISTTTSKIREYSNRYSTQSDCTAILHETLHLLGLPDEYDDDDVWGSWTRKSCRALGMADSPMKDPFIEHEDESFKNKRWAKGCYCLPDKTNCPQVTDQELITARSTMTCPSGYKYDETFVLGNLFGTGDNPEISAENFFSTAISMKVRPFMMSLDTPKVQVIVLQDKINPRGESLLYPAHVRAILFPNCFSKNEKYYTCSKEAYHRPFKFSSCGDIPTYCEHPEEWLR
jgi:hypothetical protein